MLWIVRGFITSFIRPWQADMKIALPALCETVVAAQPVF